MVLLQRCNLLRQCSNCRLYLLTYIPYPVTWSSYVYVILNLTNSVLLLVEHAIDTVISLLDDFFFPAFGVLSLSLSPFAALQ